MTSLKSLKMVKTLLASILLLTSALIGSSASRIPVALAACGANTWCIPADAPNVPNRHNVLQEVTVVNSNDVWAVGYSQVTSPLNGPKTALAMHYNGASWTLSNLNLPTNFANSNLFGASASSSSDVWAVGQYATGSANNGIKQTLILHYNGSEWRQVVSPSPGDGDNVLNAVDVVSGSDAWAVGTYDNAGVSYSLIERWIGLEGRWRQVDSPSPNLTGHNFLYGVSVIDADNVWASGLTHDFNNNNIHAELLMRWRGDETGWEVVEGAQPNPGQVAQMYKIGAVSANDVWTVGYFNDVGLRYDTLTEHWNGAVWSYVPSPAPGIGNNVLWGVAPVEHKAVWSVGYFGGNRTLTEYWDGVSWSQVTSPNVGTGVNRLFGASATPGGSLAGGYTVWAVGFSTNAHGVKQALAIRYKH